MTKILSILSIKDQDLCIILRYYQTGPLRDIFFVRGQECKDLKIGGFQLLLIGQDRIFAKVTKCGHTFEEIRFYNNTIN